MKAVIGCLLTCIFSFSVIAQESGSIPGATRITSPIEFDGIVNSNEWSEATSLPMTMHWPSYRGEITDRSLIYLAYDDDYLYVAAKLYDASPDQIQRPTFQRDLWNEYNCRSGS